MSNKTETLQIPDDLGVQLVDILYSNTKLNYDVCAVNLVSIFEHLSKKIPELNHLSQNVINTIQNSVINEELNPDLINLNQNLKYLSNLNADLQTGETNFYECNDQIETCLKQSIHLLATQTNLNVFQQTLNKNRLELTRLYEIWQLSTSKSIKNLIIQLFNLACHSDSALVSLLYENTNLTCELFCLIKQDITLDDHASLIVCLKCLIMMFTNTNQRITQRILDFLKQNDFLQTLFDTIESEKNFLIIKIKDSSKNENLAVIDLFVHLTLALNKKFQLPEDNLLIQTINLNEENRKYFSEIIINLINSETDPLIDYKIEGIPITNYDDEAFYYVNPTLKFISDLFSTAATRKSTSIFYLNDFNVLIDIIIRKLSNLSQTDQARVDYLSLMQLIIKNSLFKENGYYRMKDLLEIFNLILKETNETYDQDIVRIILFENNQFKNFN